MIPRRLLLLAIFALGLAACHGWTRYEVCFGLGTDAGKGQITERQWGQFMDGEIATRFPDGFTVYDAAGHWRDGDTSYAERSKVLLLVAPDNAANRARLDEIMQIYKTRFHQKCVLEIQTPARVAFR